jgi:arsenate reductase (thioredoxin)
MAEGLLRHLAGDRFVVMSAGTEATHVRPLAIRAMDEIGIDVSGQESKTLERYLGEPFDYVITVCDEANEACPFFPGAKNRLHWSFEDPSQAEGSEDERLAVFPRELVNRARTVVGSGRARERKHLARGWELRGMMRCGCGRKMGTRTTESSGRLFHYYVCRRSPASRKTGECAQRCVRATRVEDAMWRFVSELLKEPDKIRTGIEELIEQERDAARSDPQPETELWEEKIEECARLRSAYQGQQAAGLMTLEELSSKLAKLEETRRTAEAELAALEVREERVRELEADRDALVASYVEVLPEALDSLSGEERTRVYRMLQLEVRPDPEGYEVRGVLCNSRPRGRRRSCFTKGSSSAPLTRKPSGIGVTSILNIRYTLCRSSPERPSKPPGTISAMSLTKVSRSASRSSTRCSRRARASSSA